MSFFSRVNTGIGLAAAAALWFAAGCALLNSVKPAPAADDLRARVLQRLADDPISRSGVFGVELNGDVVQLRGTVRSAAERMRVLSLVSGTPGVASVEDRLRVIP